MSIVFDKVMCVFFSFLIVIIVDYRIKMDKNYWDGKFFFIILFDNI